MTLGGERADPMTGDQASARRALQRTGIGKGLTSLGPGEEDNHVA